MYIFIISIIIFLSSSITGVFASSTQLVQSGSIVTLSYVLKVDGKVQERNKNFSVTVGNNQLIEGFEAGLLGMRVNETKKIIVPPERGYGTLPIKYTVPLASIAPIFVKEIPKEDMADTLTITIDRKDLNYPYDKPLYVDETLVAADGTEGEIIESTRDKVTLRIENKKNPFYKKPKKVGMVIKKIEAIFRIIDFNGETYTLEVTNKRSPFYKKLWTAGEITKDSDGNTIKIIQIHKDTVDIESSHPMMGKTLEFNVRINSILK